MSEIEQARAMVLLEPVLTRPKESKSSPKIIPRPKRIEDSFSNPNAHKFYSSNIHIGQEVKILKCQSMDEQVNIQ